MISGKIMCKVPLSVAQLKLGHREKVISIQYAFVSNKHCGKKKKSVALIWTGRWKEHDVSDIDWPSFDCYLATATPYCTRETSGSVAGARRFLLPFVLPTRERTIPSKTTATVYEEQDRNGLTQFRGGDGLDEAADFAQD